MAEKDEKRKVIEVSKIVIKIGGQEIALTPDEGRKLREELNKLFSTKLSPLEEFMKTPIPTTIPAPWPTQPWYLPVTTYY